MLHNYKLYFKYIYLNQPITFFTTKFWNTQTIGVFCKDSYLYYSVLILKLSTVFYPVQLIEIFSYETNQFTLSKESKFTKPTSVTVYNFQNVLNQERFFIYTYTCEVSKKSKYLLGLSSITNLFPNAAWLEREFLEMTGAYLYGKKDTRNLMLPYGDNSSPLKKNVPSIGYREVFYDSLNDLVVTTPVSLQF